MSIEREGAERCPEMTADDVDRYFDLFDELELTVWLDGGWGVDALLGEQTRRHADLDIVVQESEVGKLRDALAELGFEDDVTSDRTDWNFVMADLGGRRIDFHVIEVDEQGRGIYGPAENGVFYPAAALEGTGTVNGRTVRCLTAGYQVQSHTGYEPDENDVRDVKALNERFGVELPAQYLDQELVGGTSDLGANAMADLLARWCLDYVGSRPASVLFERKHLSEVVGWELEDGRRVVCKRRRLEPGLLERARVQQFLSTSGYPAPRILAGPTVQGSWVMSAEEFVRAPRQVKVASARSSAAQLARLVETLRQTDQSWNVGPPVPWLRWQHEEDGTWPEPDDIDADLNAIRGPVWLEELGKQVRSALLGIDLPSVIGHGDWEAHNVNWEDEILVAVHDWDSVVELAEAAIAGAAAAVFPSLGSVVAATVEESEQFLRCYEEARAQQWSNTELQMAWLSGLWVLAYNAKKETLGPTDGPYVRVVASSYVERLARASIQ